MIIRQQETADIQNLKVISEYPAKFFLFGIYEQLSQNNRTASNHTHEVPLYWTVSQMTQMLYVL